MGRYWVALGAIWGASWAPLGALLGHLEASKAHRKRRGGKAKIIDFPIVFERVWLPWGVPMGALRALGAVLWPSWGLLEIVGSYLAPSSAIWSHLGGLLGASEALLESSWAILGAPTPRETPSPGPGEGVGGGVNPSPEQGKKGLLWKRKERHRKTNT